jgi:hypothetical protein
MSTNSYLTPDCVKGTDASACNSDRKKEVKFALGSDIVVLCAKDNDEIGFAYTVFGRRVNGKVREIIIAYRGTENLADWWYGNIRSDQNLRGHELYKKWRKKADAMGRDVKVTVTGHSLGGAISTYISLREKGANSYVFNTSPRFRRPAGEIPDNDRESVVEFGEVLKVLRIFGKEPTQNYVSIGASKGGPITQHSMRRLAEALTAAAAWENCAARESLARNNIKPDPQPQGQCQ